FSVAPDADTTDDRDRANAVERLLAATLATLQLDRLDLALATALAVTGDAAMKVTWDDDRQRPRVVAVDPAALVVHHAPGDPWSGTTVFHGYGQTGADVARLVGNDRADRLALDPDRVYPVIETWDNRRWRLTVAGQEVLDTPNPYGWIPYVLAAND